MTEHEIYGILKKKMEEKRKIHMTVNEVESQRSGRNKSTQVNHTYVNGGTYRKKFDSISDSKDLNRLLYKLAKRMLEHRAGTEYEDMYWIDLDTLMVVAEELNAKTVKEIVYSDKTKKIITEYKNDPQKRLLTIHTHPSSFPPSIPDFNANFENCYNIGVVICHNGKIFLYAADEELNERYYNLLVAKKLNQGYNDYEARLITLQEMQKTFEIVIKEVMEDDNGK